MYEKNGSVFGAGIAIFLMVVITTIGGLWFYQKRESYSNSNSFDSDQGIYSGFPYAPLPLWERSWAQKVSGGTELISPTIAKRCAEGPYMYTSNPYLQAICQGVSNEELAQVACGKAFHGRPVHFDYTSLSDGA